MAAGKTLTVVRAYCFLFAKIYNSFTYLSISSRPVNITESAVAMVENEHGYFLQRGCMRVMARQSFWFVWRRREGKVYKKTKKLANEAKCVQRLQKFAEDYIMYAALQGRRTKFWPTNAEVSADRIETCLFLNIV